MGYKYTIRMMRSGVCQFNFDWGTNNIFRAIWLLLKAMYQFPIVDFQIRRGYVACEECTVDYCDKNAPEEVPDDDQRNF